MLSVIAALTVMAGSAIAPFKFSPSGVVQAQPSVVLRQVVPADIAAQVYAQYPDFPQENAYTRQGNGELAVDDTLVSRLIRYHLYVQNRPPNFRLDWKLTIADYLDAFNLIRATRYPSADVLSENPMLGDKAAIQAMTRQQRNQLSQSLFDIFIGRETTASPGPVPSASEPGSDREIEPEPPPTPGAADLL